MGANFGAEGLAHCRTDTTGVIPSNARDLGAVAVAGNAAKNPGSLALLGMTSSSYFRKCANHSAQS